MFKKYIKQILIVTVVVLAIAVLGSGINNLAFRHGAGERAAELERRAQQLEINLAESNRIRTKTIGALREAESELSRLRDALRETEEYIAGLRNENTRLRNSITELSDIRRELAGETDELENLAQRIGDGAREALGIVERLQAGSREAD